jgi:hypothetical protein
MAIDVSIATEFIKSVDLSGTPRGILPQDAAEQAGEIFDQTKAQAQVVGSALFSFTQGVDTQVREAISDSALLAQLVANKRASAEETPLDWFRVYSEVLQNVGWTLQDSGWTDYTANGTAVEVDEKIIEVMTVALGATPAALAILTSTIKALKAMAPNSSWIAIFSRESQKARLARFQIGIVDKDKDGDVFVSLLACLIQAESAITQVLFFKFKSSNATFQANSVKVSINRAALNDLGPKIRDRIRAYQADYLSTIVDV